MKKGAWSEMPTNVPVPILLGTGELEKILDHLYIIPPEHKNYIVLEPQEFFYHTSELVCL